MTPFQPAPTIPKNVQLATVSSTPTKVDTSPVNIAQLQNTGIIPSAPTGSLAQDNVDYTADRALANPRVTDRTSGLSRLADLFEQQGKQGERFNTIAQEQKLFESEDALNKAREEEARIDRQYENKLRQMREGAVGMSEGALQAQEREIGRKRSQEKADLAIITAARQGDFNTAQNIVKQKVDMEFEPLKQQIDTLKTFLTLNQDDLTAREKIELQAQIDQQSTQLESDYSTALTQQQATPYLTAIQDGSLAIKDVPKELQASVLNLMQQNGIVDSQTQAKTQSDIKLIDNLFELINDPALGASTGFFGSRLPSWKTLTGATNDFISFQNILNFSQAVKLASAVACNTHSALLKELT
jgi:hypothetical protein